MKYRETGNLIDNNKTHRTWSLIGCQRHKLNMKKPRQDDGASFFISILSLTAAEFSFDNYSKSPLLPENAQFLHKISL